MKYAIIKSGSAQFKVSEGDKVKILGFTQKPVFDVLFFSDGKNSYTETNDLKEVKLGIQVVGQQKARKVKVGRFKAKSRYDKTRGFRAQYTNVLISKLDFGTKETKETKVEKVVKPKTVVKKAVKKVGAKTPKAKS